MNSRQVNFFLTARDQAELLTQLAAVGDFIVVAGTTKSGGVNRLESAEIKQMGVDRLQVYLMRPNDIGGVRFHDVPKMGYKSVDVLRSPVVEFDRCYHAEGLLRRGRLYVVTAFYDGMELTRKDGAFLQWAGALIKTARRKLTKDPRSFFYFGADALRCREAGTTMEMV
jgi:hypothetical protein